MKTILLSLLILIIPTLSFSQNRDLPQYFIEGGDTIGILLSIEQVQKLDNNSELLDLFKQLQIDCDNIETSYAGVINKCNEKIALLELNLSDFRNQSIEKDDLISNLKTQLSNSESNKSLCDVQIVKKNEEISILKSDLRKEKFKKWISTGGNVILAAASVFLLLKL
jgi:predicted RNase H-like nuclease (RuvC/YqgF family)